MKKYQIPAYIQMFYFLLTIIWPFVHLESFLKITGPKTDIWLVKTVSLLLFPYILLIVYVLRIKQSPLVILAIMLCCAGLAGIDLYYYLNNVIRWTYMIDCILEILFIGYWIFILKIRSENKSVPNEMR
ncbi:hypothetical protein J2786_000077 [Chryseobacterium vietnamense]|uniref:Uncharacterized protein n=1 Tax=Chryseobacterium vietnamense TaxID=866785 RepID=A0ACC6J209_9FLAO|nr:hypothetical protein [Chryseobacterium vietnamense]MDR6456984.1 hypothetical protein [Chryseobacterium vietnamense]